MPSTDLATRRKHWNNWYARNKAKERGRRIRRRKIIADLVLKAKSGPCVDCGNSYPSYVMDLDHRDRSTKACNPSELPTRTVSLKRAAAEIAKCDPVCANCHRERTYGPKR